MCIFWICFKYKVFMFLVVEHNDVILINAVIESQDAVFYENMFDKISRLKSSKDLESNKCFNPLPLMSK